MTNDYHFTCGLSFLQASPWRENCMHNGIFCFGRVLLFKCRVFRGDYVCDVFIWKLKNYVLHLEQQLVTFLLMFATTEVHSWLALEVLGSSNMNIVHLKTWPSVWNFITCPPAVRAGNRGLGLIDLGLLQIFPCHPFW